MSVAPAMLILVAQRTQTSPRNEDEMHGETSFHIDCDSCQVRGLACNDCMVTVLLGPPPELGFDDEERRALSALADVGLIPPLRMVQPMAGPEVESA